MINISWDNTLAQDIVYGNSTGKNKTIIVLKLIAINIDLLKSIQPPIIKL